MPKFLKFWYILLKKEKSRFFSFFQNIPIFYLWALFVLFLPINVDKPHYNINNSMAAMIFLNIKLAEIMKLIQYAI